MLIKTGAKKRVDGNNVLFSPDVSQSKPRIWERLAINYSAGGARVNFDDQ